MLFSDFACLRFVVFPRALKYTGTGGKSEPAAAAERGRRGGRRGELGDLEDQVSPGQHGGERGRRGRNLADDGHAQGQIRGLRQVRTVVLSCFPQNDCWLWFTQTVH